MLFFESGEEKRRRKKPTTSEWLSRDTPTRIPNLSTAHVNEGGNNSSSTNVVIVLWSHDQLYPPSWLSSKLLGGEKGVLCDFSNRDFFLHALKVVHTSYLVFAW